MNTNTKRAAAVTAAAVAITGSALVTSASADSACGPGVEAKVSQRMVHNPASGKREMGTVTECPDTSTRSTGGTISSITPSEGVDFRNNNGFKTGSGLSNRDRFRYLGETRTFNGEVMIRVKQITSGMGGYGSLYEGWIPVRFTANPSMFN
ncbi:hypothetical protein ABT282_07515 [Streptomyces sp. NPDC000927]|uniref:hypothetical protein n=1 Tax=Streptomyces sp. NPDC000927 TaxID=3154371 RepID=UPI003329935C